MRLDVVVVDESGDDFNGTASAVVPVFDRGASSNVVIRAS